MAWRNRSTAIALGATLLALTSGARGGHATPPEGERDGAPEQETRHALALRGGLRTTTVRESLLVPLTFSGAGPALGAAYHARLGPGVLAADVDVGGSVVANRFGHAGLTIDHALDVGYTFALGEIAGWRFGAGGVVGESTDVLQLLTWDDAHGYWFGLGWLGVGGTFDRPLAAGWRLEGSAALALAGTAGRPPLRRETKQEPTMHLDYYVVTPHAGARPFLGPLDVQHLRFDVAARLDDDARAGDVLGRGWAFGCQGRVTRAALPAELLALEAVVYTSWTWGM